MLSRFFVMLNWFTSDEIEVVIFTELIRGNNLKIMFFELYSFQSKRATVSLYLVKIYFINIYFRAREKSYVVLTQHRRTLETPSSSGNREFYPIPHFFFLNASVNSLFVSQIFPSLHNESSFLHLFLTYLLAFPLSILILFLWQRARWLRFIMSTDMVRIHCRRIGRVGFDLKRS